MATLAGKKLLANHVGINFQWTKDGELAGAGGSFDNVLVVPELRDLGLPDVAAPSMTFHLGDAPPELVAQLKAAIIALHEHCVGQIDGATAG
jgi:hypothetical protein